MKVSIEEFHKLLTSDEESPLLEALRSLMTIEKSEDIFSLAAENWENWEAV